MTTLTNRLRRRRLLYPLLFVACFLAYTLSPVTYRGSDTSLTFPTAVSMVHTGDLTLDEFTEPMVQTHYSNWKTPYGSFTGFPWAVALFLVPVVVAVDAASAVTGRGDAVDAVNYDKSAKYELIGASLVVALCVIAVAALVEQRLRRLGNPRPRRNAVVSALVFAFGTSAWSIASRAMWQHGPSMLLATTTLLLAGTVAATQGPGRRRVLLVGAMGMAMGLAEAVRPTNGIAVVLFAGWLLWKHRRLVWAYAAGLLLVLVPWAAVNYISFRRILPLYFTNSELLLHDHFFDAIAANLVSPSRGILAFSPVFVLSLVGGWLTWRRRRGDMLELLAAVATFGILIACSAFGMWWAGDTFGPRFMSETIPYMIVLAVPAIDRLTRRPADGTRPRWWAAAVVAAVASSVVVHAQGAFLDAAVCWTRLPAKVGEDLGRFWSFTDPQMTRGLRVMIEEGSYSAAASQQCPPT